MSNLVKLVILGAAIIVVGVCVLFGSSCYKKPYVWLKKLCAGKAPSIKKLFNKHPEIVDIENKVQVLGQ